MRNSRGLNPVIIAIKTEGYWQYLSLNNKIHFSKNSHERRGFISLNIKNYIQISGNGGYAAFGPNYSTFVAYRFRSI